MVEFSASCHCPKMYSVPSGGIFFLMLSICCKQMFYQEQLDNSSSFQTETMETVNHLCKQRQSLNVWAAALGFSDTFNASFLIVKDLHYKYLDFQLVHSVAA